jgi:Prenyltransferase and squalene oxidase repeat
LATRVNALRKLQNSDGGWAYFPGKQSWLEPTLFAALALHGEPEADRAWELVSTWQEKDGGWHPSAEVGFPHASTALAVTVAMARGEFGTPFQNGVQWLLGAVGAESQMYKRIILRVGSVFGMVEDQRDFSLKGWPWKLETSSWVEPTSHALVALKKAAAKIPGKELHERVRLGEEMLLNVRCVDGGWNYGNRTARGDELVSYPETTGIALMGLQGRPELGPALDLAGKMLRETASPMALAWLTIAMRVNGIFVEPRDTKASPDVLITALEALGAPEGNYSLLKVTA